MIANWKVFASIHFPLLWEDWEWSWLWNHIVAMGKDWKREREKERRKARTTQYIYLMAIHLDDSNGNNRKSFENSTSLCIFFMCFWYTLSVRKTAHHGSCFSFRDFSQMIERMPGTKTVNISTKHGSMEFSYYQITEIVSVFFSLYLCISLFCW